MLLSRPRLGVRRGTGARPLLARPPAAAPPALAEPVSKKDERVSGLPPPEAQPPKQGAAKAALAATGKAAPLARVSDPAAARAAILSVVADSAGRGKGGLSPADAAAFEAAVALLEADGGVPAARRTSDPRLWGRWALLFTSNAARTASPIQRSFTGSDAVYIFQEVEPPVVSRTDGSLISPVSVTNVVEAPAVGTLRVRARAATAGAPIPGFQPRAGAGFPLLGKSSSAPPAAGPGTRLDFAFQSAAFYWSTRLPALLPPLPYPVPFSLFERLGGPLGDEVKGWLDVTYLAPDGRFRLSRGNKGTLFVLSRPDEAGAAEALAGARAAGLDGPAVEALARALAASGAGVPSPAQSPLAAGKWRLVWSEQAPDANPLQAALAGRVANWQVVGTGEDGSGVENVVNLAPGGAVQVVAIGACAPASPTRTAIDITGVELRLLGGAIRLPLFKAASSSSSGAAGKKGATPAGGLRAARPTTPPGAGFIDWLFLSPSLRVTRGSKGSLFVHVRDD